MLIEHKDATFDKYGNWDANLDAKFENLFNQHGDDFIHALTDCIFELDTEMGSIEMLFECILTSDRFKSTATKEALLKILDFHPDAGARRQALFALRSSRYETTMNDLQDRYKNANVDIKEDIGEIILDRVFKKAGADDYYGIAKSICVNNFERLNKENPTIQDNLREIINNLKIY